MSIRPVAPTDFLFLTLEKRHQPMHVGGLFLFKLPEDAPPTFIQDLVADIREAKIPPIEPFNQVLKGLFWATDKEFDLDHHFRHIALPAPGRIRELLVYVSQAHSALLDRAKPLWMCHIIEGIEGNRFGIYFKIHHALIDGIAGMRLIEKSFCADPNQRVTLPLWSIETAKPQHQSNTPSLRMFKKAYRLTRDQVTGLPTVFQELNQMVKERRQSEDYVSTANAPSSIFNQRISSGRRFAAQSFKLERFQHIASALDATINDVIIAMCAGAIRNYLISLDQLPKRPLIAMVPASIRIDDSYTGNRLTMMLANLATDTANPLKRLSIIKRSLQLSKNRFNRMTPQQILNYSALIYGPTGLHILSGLLPKQQAFNLVISNVAGPTKPLYWNGAQLDAIYPASIVCDGQALNITLTSYMDKLEVGLTACRKSVPKMQNLLTLLEEELQIFEHLAVNPDLTTTESHHVYPV